MIRKILKKNKSIRELYFFSLGMNSFFNFQPVLLIKQYVWFLKQFKHFRGMKANHACQKVKWFPCLSDNLSHTPLDATYFFQDTWAASKIFKLKPERHVDVGSSAMTMGILSQFVPVTMIDIRPIELEIDGLSFQKGSILALPFDDEVVETISSLCVVEHIGLGRYGDSIDPFGSEKAIVELKRVLKIGGVILFSVPVDSENKIYFNAHRAFTRDYILELFSDFKILDEKYHYGTSMYDEYDNNKGFGTGLFMLKKEK